MQFTIKPFKELTPFELYAALQLRNAVFVIEQNCIYNDTDDKDQEAIHVLMSNEENLLVGYARILPPGVSYKEASIGRVVVDRNYRKSGTGRSLMKRSINETLQLYQDQNIVISAQAYLIKFYTGLGFHTEGEGYLEDNIPHIKMRYTGN